MFDSIIIINLLETIVYQNPTDPSDILKQFLTQIKKSCIKNCTQPNLRFVKKIHIYKDEKKIRKKVFARINEQSIIVGIIVPVLENSEIDIWEIIDEIFDIMEMIDVNEPKELEEIKPRIDELLRNINIKQNAHQVFVKENREDIYKSELDSIKGSNIIYKDDIEENKQNVVVNGNRNTKKLYKSYVEGDGFFDKNQALWFFLIGGLVILFALCVIFIIKIFQ